LGVECGIDQDRIAEESDCSRQKDEDTLRLVYQMGNELYGGNKHEGWESDAVEQTQDTQESQGDTGADLDVVLVIPYAVDEH
jgi:hypothetical protein